MRRICGLRILVFMLALGVILPASVLAQTTVLKVIGSDSVPVPFAWVSVEGGTANITDEKGTLSATFIGPEEIEKRHPSNTSDMLYGLNGVTMVHDRSGAIWTGSRK